MLWSEARKKYQKPLEVLRARTTSTCISFNLDTEFRYMSTLHKMPTEFCFNACLNSICCGRWKKVKRWLITISACKSGKNTKKKRRCSPPYQRMSHRESTPQTSASLTEQLVEPHVLIIAYSKEKVINNFGKKNKSNHASNCYYLILLVTSILKIQ